MELGEKEIKPLLEKAIDDAIANGYVTFITGMAMGTDIWAAEIVLERKKRNKNLHLICALPHPDFESRRRMKEKMRFNRIIKKAATGSLFALCGAPSCSKPRPLAAQNKKHTNLRLV